MPEILTAEEMLEGKKPSITPNTDMAMRGLNPSGVGVYTSGSALGPTPFTARKIAAEGERGRFMAENVRDVPLDVESGLPALTRAKLSFRREVSDQVKFLQDKYGPEAVRLSTEGTPIVRVTGEDGKPRDVLADEDKITLSDLADVAGTVPEIAAAIFSSSRVPKAASNSGGLRRGWAALQRIVAGATGAQATGAATDVGVRVLDDQPMRFGEIAQERAKLGLVDMAFGAAGETGASFFQWLKNPLAGNRTAVQFDALAAQKYFKDKYGIEVPLSVGESTGSDLASRTEAFVEKLPGGSEPAKALKKKQEDSLRELQRIMMSGTSGTDEEVGNKMMEALRMKVQPLEEGAKVAREGLSSTAEGEIRGAIDSALGSATPLNKSEVGQLIKGRVTVLRDAARAKADAAYAQVNALPGGTGKIFPTTGLAAEAKKILDNLPAPEKQVTKVSPIAGPTGQPITTTSSVAETDPNFVPPNVLARLRSLADLGNAKVSLSDLQQMRREVYDDIARGQGVPGLGTHYLADIGKALTKAIDSGINSMPGGQLKTALQNANKIYKDEVIPFNDSGISELFRRSNENPVGDFELVNKIIKNPDSFNQFKRVLGATSPEFTAVKRTIADDLLRESSIKGTDLLDAATFINKITALRNFSPEITDEVFGKNIKSLVDSAKYLELAQGAKFSLDDLKFLAAKGTPSSLKLRELIAAQEKLDDAYSNRILKEASSGSLKEVKPSEFVARFIDNAEPSEVKKVMTLMDAKTTEEVRAKTIQKVLNDATRPAKAGDLNQILSGDKSRLVGSLKITEQLRDNTFREKLQDILGPDAFEDFTQYVKLSTAPERKEEAFKAAGGLAAGTQIASLAQGNLYKYLNSSVVNYITAKIITFAPLRSFFKSIPDEPGKMALILSSGPFLRALAEENGLAPQQVAAQIKEAVTRDAQDRGQVVTPQLTAEEMLME